MVGWRQQPVGTARAHVVPLVCGHVARRLAWFGRSAQPIAMQHYTTGPCARMDSMLMLLGVGLPVWEACPVQLYTQLPPVCLWGHRWLKRVALIGFLSSWHALKR